MIILIMCLLSTYFIIYKILIKKILHVDNWRILNSLLVLQSIHSYCENVLKMGPSPGIEPKPSIQRYIHFISTHIMDCDESVTTDVLLIE